MFGLRGLGLRVCRAYKRLLEFRLRFVLKDSVARGIKGLWYRDV